MTLARPCTCDRFVPGRQYIAGRDCAKCWMFAHRPAVRKAWGGNPADCPPLWPVRPDGTENSPSTGHDEMEEVAGRRRPCVHLGPYAGVMVPCIEGCNGVQLKLMNCALHGVATIAKRGKEATACCRDCLDYEAARKLQVNHGAGGLGDALLGLCALGGLKAKQPEMEITYRVHPAAIPFVSLFAGGYDALLHHVHDNNKDAAPSPDMQMNLGYNHELRTRAKETRIQRYCRNLGGVTPRLPALRHRERLLAAGRDYAGAVVLAPFSTWSNREWRIESWLTLEAMLIAAGYPVVVLDKQDARFPNRHAAMRSEVVLDAPAHRVAGIVLNAAITVGNDSGIAHLAGIMGRPAVVVCGQTVGDRIFNCYPQVTCLQGRLDCDGCWWQEPFVGTRCDASCASMQSVLPSDVLRAVDAVCLPAYTGGDSILQPDKLAVIRDAVLATNHLPGDVAEFGVYRGGTARLIGHYARGTPVHLFDTFAGMPFDDTAANGDHGAGDFADCTVPNVPNAVIHKGIFPDTAPPAARYRFAHVDFDLEQSTRAAIDYLRPRMAAGGRIVFDDYGWFRCPGVAAAIHAAFGEHVPLGRPTLHQAVLHL